MIATIGSLVQETATRTQWLWSTTLYTLACISSSVALGCLLGGAGSVAQMVIPALRHDASAPLGVDSVGLVGFLALAYAASDLQLILMPRPRLSNAVPVTWWRRWRPYGAALAYGAALGIGFTTRIPFGAFYVLCAWCLVLGNVPYGAALFGVYGATRALALIPASCFVQSRQSDISPVPTLQAAQGPFAVFFLLAPRAKALIALLLVVFGVQLLALAGAAAVSGR